VPTKGKRAQASRSEARSYLAKADEFIETANSAAGESSHDATMLNAIHAAISATDAVTVALAGVRSTDPDHLRVVDLLEEVSGGQGDLSKQASQLRQLLSRKNIVEYESRRAGAREAADALKRAGRLVAWARQVVDAARL
jgi:HEPN domain-containing protein